MAERASESQHWYYSDGSPAYTVIGANGKERNTTLRDARKLNLKPSVTTILKESNKPALNSWIADQLLMAALTLPKIDGESETEWLTRVREDSKQTAIKAAERGIQVHAWVQGGFENNISLDTDAIAFYECALNAMGRDCNPQGWICEKPFATDRYGGKTDLHTSEIILDIKTTEKPLDTIKTWDEHAMQLSAYRQGLCYPGARCGILYINVLTVGAKLLWIEEAELIKGMKMFNALLDYWYAKTGL